VSYVENNPGTVIDSTLLIDDSDSANLVSATVQLSFGFNATQDSLLFTNQLGITGSYNSANGVLTLTGSTTVANYRTALRSVAYANSSDNPNPAVRMASFTVHDGTANSVAAEREINIVTSNDVPTVDLNGIGSGLNYTAAFIEGTGPAAIVSPTVLTVSDLDNAFLASTVIKLTTVYDIGAELLTVNTSGTSLNAAYNVTNGTLNLTGVDTVAHYEQVLRTLTYNNLSTTPNPTQRQVTVSVNDGVGSSVNVTSFVTVTATNSAPVISLTAGAASYLENASPAVIDGSLTITDADSTSLTGASVAITAGYVSGDTLSVGSANGLTISYNAATYILSLSGSATVATYQNVLRTVRFHSTNDDPTAAVRTIQLVASDSTTSSAPVTRLLNVTPSNDLATVDLNGGAAGVNYTASYTAMSSTVAIVGANSLTINDPDNALLSGATVSLNSVPNTPNETLAVNVGVTAITSSYNATTGVLSLSGADTVANYQQVLRTLTYTNTAIVPVTTTRTVSTVVNDGAALSSPVTSTILFSLVGGGTSAPVLRLSGASGSTPFAATFTEGASAVAIAGTSGTGAATLTDSDSPTMASAAIMLLSPLDGANEILSAVTTGTAITATYDTTNAARYVLRLTGVDTVANYQTVLRTIQYNNSSDTPNANGTGNPVRTVQWIVNDGGNNSSTVIANVTVRPTNDAPLLITSATPLAYLEDASATLATTPIDPAITITDIDSTQIQQATIAITGNFAAGEDVLTYTPGPIGAGSFVYNPATGVATLTATSTLAAFQTALRNVSYRNTSHLPTTTTRTVSFTVKDVSAAINGSQVSPVATRQINLTATNDLAELDLNGTAAAGLNANAAHVSSGAAVNISALNAALSDRDDVIGGAGKSLTVTLTGNVNGANETLSANVSGTGLVAVYNSLSSALSVSGVGTISQYQQVLRSVKYNNVALTRTAGNRTATFVYSDGTGNSNFATTTIAVGSPLLAEGGAITGGVSSTLTRSQLQPMIAAAIDRWTATGLTGAQISTLKSTQFVIANLDGAGALGLTMPGVVQVDDNGAGRGWFIDSSPYSDAEFRRGISRTELNATTGVAANHYDLLTLVMHELGHVLGLNDFDENLRSDDVMSEAIGVGTRRLPMVGEADPIFRNALNAVFSDLATSTNGTVERKQLATTKVAGVPLDQL
ncbi:MAG: hypothetical protein JNM18_24465, partial [Planctomycetaceae bacterium]|nr:hypothetical protein [Planctomycetaceae bacterium]